MNTRTRNIKK